MKYRIFFWTMLLLPSLAIATPPLSNSVTQPISSAEKRYGVKNFKMVMPGVLYRGGSCGGQNPLSTISLQKLCNDNFTTATYVYGKNWDKSKVVNPIKCEKGEINYIMRKWDRSTEVNDILKRLYQMIVTGKGTMYLHCWYGVHASGYVSAVALKQFCGLSSEQAVSYWNSNVPKKIQYEKVQNMIRAFKLNPTLQLTPQQQAHVCPIAILKNISAS